MPNIPRYTRRKVVQPVGKAPVPISAADTGAEAIGAGLQGVGKGVSNIGEAVAKLELQKQQIRDNAALATANEDYDKAVRDIIDEARRTTFSSIEQFDEFRKRAETDLDSSVQNSISKMS